jgi:hypothetical protein
MFYSDGGLAIRVCAASGFGVRSCTDGLGVLTDWQIEERFGGGAELVNSGAYFQFRRERGEMGEKEMGL